MHGFTVKKYSHALSTTNYIKYNVIVSLPPTVNKVRAATIPPGITTEGARCYSSLHCDSSAEIGFMTNVDCCRSEPRGLAYNVPGTEECVPCVCK